MKFRSEPIPMLRLVIVSLTFVAIHLGLSEYVSIQFFAVIALFAWLILAKKVFVTKSFLVFYLLLASFWLVVTALKGNLWELLMIARMLFNLLFLGVALSSLRNSSVESSQSWAGVAKFSASVTLVLAVTQLISYRWFGSTYFFLDAAFFSLEYGTLNTEIDSFVSRPKALFSEPSTLGAWGFIITVIGRLRGSRSLLVLGLSNVLVSFSVSGAVCVVAYLMIEQLHRFASMKKGFDARILIALGFAFTLALLTLHERILFILSGDDLSSMIRLTIPLSVLTEAFESGAFLGLHRSEVSAYTYNQYGVENVFDNFILNLFLMHGIFALALILLLFRIFPFKFAIVFFLLACTNGEPLYWDRSAFMFLFIVSAASSIARKGDRSRSPSPLKIS